ncbi:MAG: hypothetical protein JXB04_03540 [Kiritimatiellae bacterium]|nr:hypothetical protein [Kiritimatiellia bacterium]
MNHSRKHTRSRLGQLVAGGAVCALACGAQARVDNAALDYWRAAAVMRQPRTPEGLEVVRRVDEDLRNLPPSIFIAWPEVGRWLLDEKPMLNALAAGARRTSCDFGVRPTDAPVLNLDHLPPLKELTYRALATAKAYEYADNRLGAAEIYRDLLTMVERLDNDRNISSIMVGMELTELIVFDLEGFLAREPPQEAVRVLTTYFAGRQRPMFDLARCLREASAPFGRWLMADLARVEDRLGFLYGRAAQRPAIDRLTTLDADRKRQRLQEWVMDYESRMIRLGDAVGQPYATGLRLVREMDAEAKALAEEPLPPGANPLVGLLVPQVERLYESVLLCEAQIDMIAILSAAALHRADAGRWPVNLEEIRKHYRRRLPRDPFSGEDFYYTLVQVRPRIVTRVPRWIARKASLIYVLDVTARRTHDEELVTAAARRIAREAVAAARAAAAASSPPQRTAQDSAEAPVPLR